MSSSGQTRAVEIRNASDIDFIFPDGFSFFEPYLQYFVKETLGAGGQAYVSRNSEGTISGIFIYDYSEKTGTIYTRSRRVFYYFYELRTSDFLFAEMKTEHESEIYDIYHVKPQFRRMGIGEDILFARLLWLTSKRARSAFSEISRENSPSSRIAMKGHMTASGQIFQYFGKDSDGKTHRKS